MNKKHLWLICATCLICLLSFVGSPAHASDTLPVNDWVEFKATLTGAHNNDVVELKAHIKGTDKADMVFSNSTTDGLVKTPVLVDKGGCTLHLNGFSVVVSLEADGGFIPAILGVQPGATLTIIGPGEISTTPGDAIALANNGTLTIKDITAMAGDTALYNASEGGMIVEGGFFDGARTTMFNAGQAEIQKGAFYCSTGPALIQAAAEHLSLQGGSFNTGVEDGPAIVSLHEPVSAILAKGYAFYENNRPLTLNSDQKELKGMIEVRHADSSADPGPEPTTPTLMSTDFFIGEWDVHIYQKGSELVERMDVAPYIKNGRTMLPLRFVAQSLGATVNFDAQSRDVSFTLQGRNIRLNLDRDIAQIDGTSHKLDSQPEIVNGRTMLPIGEIADLLGLSRGEELSPAGNLVWNESLRMVSIVIQKNA